MTLLSEALAEPLVLMFGYRGELFDMTVRGFRIYMLAFLFAGINVFASSMFTALNNGLVSAIISFLRMCVFQASAVMLVPLFLGLDGVWCSHFFSEIAALIVTVICLLSLKKRYGY